MGGWVGWVGGLVGWVGLGGVGRWGLGGRTDCASCKAWQVLEEEVRGRVALSVVVVRVWVVVGGERGGLGLG